MQFSKVSSLLIYKLADELPENLTYHNVAHTERVIETALILADGEGLNEEEKTIVATAALFHDSGYLFGTDDHEERSCSLAREYLPAHEYSPEQTEAVCRLITATKNPQSPTDRLEKILCDADLSYLGTEAFRLLSSNLYKELKSVHHRSAVEMWPEKQMQFLKTHRYHTETARKLFDKKKQQNLKALMKSYHPANANANKQESGFVVQDFLLILAGVLMAGFALKGFLVPNHFFDGGITGISLLLHEQYHWNLGYIIVLANVPFILVSYKAVNLRFAIKTFTSVLILGICLLYFPYPIITSDKLLISIFGGFFLGIGIGLTMRAGCALDGVEVLALFTIRRTSFTITEIILAINVLIFLIAAFKFGLETALYSILTYFTASKTIDYVVEGIEAYTGVTIISGQSEIMKERLVNQLGRGITVYKGERGFLPGHFDQSSDCDIIFTVVTRLEMRRLKNLVSETDPKAFVFASTIKEATGGILRRRATH
jgi:uncharacterized membrane-anchored protein YitT (DUF2179 family)/predicted metal-dependent HD superfamily phosphohydrolase